jgi:predicted transposase YdaD
MKESSTYQAILAEGRTEGRAEGRVEGRAEEARRLLRLLGDRRFGPPDARNRAAIESLTSVERLEQLTERLLEASGWDELLASERPPRRTRRPQGS